MTHDAKQSYFSKMMLLMRWSLLVSLLAYRNVSANELPSEMNVKVILSNRGGKMQIVTFLMQFMYAIF